MKPASVRSGGVVLALESALSSVVKSASMAQAKNATPSRQMSVSYLPSGTVAALGLVLSSPPRRPRLCHVGLVSSGRQVVV